MPPRGWWTALPRETAVENALGRGGVLQGSAFGGYGELTLNVPGKYVLVFTARGDHRPAAFRAVLRPQLLRPPALLLRGRGRAAVSSAGDRGEVEVEQAYLDGLLGRRVILRGGVIIMPVGIVNVYHEPPTFNGVDRPDVDSVIIPSTWREAGIGVFGELAEGLRYQPYLVNGFPGLRFLGRGRGSHATGIRRLDSPAPAARLRTASLASTTSRAWATIVGASGYRATSGNTLTSTVGKVPVTPVRDRRAHRNRRILGARAARGVVHRRRRCAEHRAAGRGARGAIPRPIRCRRNRAAATSR